MNTSTHSQWPARGIGYAGLAPALLICLAGVALWLLERSPSTLGVLANLLRLGAVAAGCAALAWIRPQRAGLSPPHVMLSLGFGGMLAGLLYDVVQVGPQRLAALCSQSAAAGFIDSVQLHAEFLPGMHVGMLAGGLLAIPALRLLRPHCGRYLCSLLAQNLVCSGWMLTGMTAGALWLSRWQPGTGRDSLPDVLGGMFVGMTWGMVVSVALYRAFFAWRRRDQFQIDRFDTGKS